MKIQEPSEIEKAEILVVANILEYVPNSIVIKTIIRKRTGNITAMSFDSGEALAEKSSPFDTFIQVIEGKAEIVIDKISHSLTKDNSIIIPSHKLNSIKANERFKIISTVIKSGYDEMD